MRIAIGTQNSGKIAALEQALAVYPNLAHYTVVPAEVDSGVSAQPKTLDETLQGAMNRARTAMEATRSDLGCGLESGVFPVPYTKSGYMDTTACAIWDGTQFHLGLSSCFEYPASLMDRVLNQGQEISEAAVELGFTDSQEFRHAQGMIGVLTKGVIPRTDYSAQAVHTALIHLNNPEHY